MPSFTIFESPSGKTFAGKFLVIIQQNPKIINSIIAQKISSTL
jgi:hypothetical protein